MRPINKMSKSSVPLRYICWICIRAPADECAFGRRWWWLGDSKKLGRFVQRANKEPRSSSESERRQERKAYLPSSLPRFIAAPVTDSVFVAWLGWRRLFLATGRWKLNVASLWSKLLDTLLCLSDVKMCGEYINNLLQNWKFDREAEVKLEHVLYWFFETTIAQINEFQTTLIVYAPTLV